MLYSIRFSVLFLALLLAGCATTGNLSTKNEQKLVGKTFVITGASSGFGRGVAVKLGHYKANVVLAARRTELLEEVAGEVRATGGTALVVTTDVSKPDDVARLMAEALKAYGKVDVWINNAGVGTIGPFWDVPVEEMSRIIDVNLKGTIYGSYAAIRQFRTQGYGVLLNVGSVESEVPMAYHDAYAASKAGVSSLGQSIAQELRLAGLKNIRVVTVMPWATDTPWWRHAGNHSGGTPRFRTIDGPEKVVAAIIWASLHRKTEVPVGGKAKAAFTFHHIFPHTTERISANAMHRYQIETAPPAPPTSGSLFEPMSGGRGVEDSVRARIKEENRQRKKAKR